jgi:hypothetical protein
MNRRLLRALVAVLALAAVFPAAASADVFIAFTTLPDAPARVEAMDFDDEAPVRIEVVRGGAVVAEGLGSVELPGLEPGDTARTASASATFDGTPAFGDVCFGSTTFTVTRPADAFLFDAGAGVLADEGPSIESTVSEDSPAVVTLSRPLAQGDAAFASVLELIDGGMLGVTRAVRAKDCGGAPPQPPAGSPGPGTPDTPSSESTAPLSGALARLKRLGLARLAHARTHALPVAFTQPGTVKVKLLARGKLIGAGTRTAGPGEHRVTVKLTAAGRRLLRRATRVKLTLVATLTPSRAGEAPQRASIGVTLRR